MALVRRQQQTPARRSPAFGHLARLRNEIDRLFQPPLEFGLGDFLEGNWVPPVDLKDSGDHVLVKAELPGMKPEEIQLSVHENTLTISGERKEEEEQGQVENHQLERYFGRFHRLIPLPQTVDSNKIQATYNDGVLTIRLPKTEQAEPRQIQIKSQ
jgi:HSP20 family protein